MPGLLHTLQQLFTHTDKHQADVTPCYSLCVPARDGFVAQRQLIIQKCVRVQDEVDPLLWLTFLKTKRQRSLHCDCL